MGYCFSSFLFVLVKSYLGANFDLMRTLENMGSFTRRVLVMELLAKTLNGQLLGTTGS